MTVELRSKTPQDVMASSPLSTSSDTMMHPDEDDKGHTSDTGSSVFDSDDVSPLKRKYELLNIKPAYVENGIPVFKPTWEEFKDFYVFQKSINKYGMQSGIVKVIPPKEWVNNEMPKTYPEDIISNIHFKSPIAQEFTNHSNCFSINNIEKKKTFNLLQWKKLSYNQNYLIPPMKGEKDPKYNKPTTADQKKFSLVKGNSNAVADDAFKGFKYNIDTSIYTKERCEYLENQYWKTISFSTPLYGADSLGSLFKKDQRVWNVAQLPNLLDWLPEKLPGVNDAYLYGGLWKASFSWHLEDQDLYSINYLHFGAPKQWYSISQKDHMKFYHLMSEIFPDDHSNCSEFLRHKTFLASPAFLSKKGIEVNKITHYEKEFIITYPYGYHSGFNYGYNLAESVNFALDDWLPIGLASKRCMCIEDSVGIDVGRLAKRLNGDFTETEDELETSESEVESESSSEEIKGNKEAESKIRRKRKTIPNKKESLSVLKVKPVPIQCILCPNELSHNFTNSHQFEQLGIYASHVKEDGTVMRKAGSCHRLCAQAIPEISIMKKKELSGIEFPEEEADFDVAVGLESIPNARKNLKCILCSQTVGKSIKGVCMQCTHGKCTRAYHPTCALASGMMFVEGEENHITGVCRYHRKSKKAADIDTSLPNISPATLIQFKLAGDFYSGRVISNNASETTFDILIYNFNNGTAEVIEVPYQNVLISAENAFVINLDIRVNNISVAELQKKQAQEEKEMAKIALKEARAKKKQDAALLREERRKNHAFNISKYELEFVKEFDKFYRKEETNFGPLYNNEDAMQFIESTRPEAIDHANFKEDCFYFYMPDVSTDNCDRFRNDLSLNVPNDPGYLKFLEKQQLEKERAIRRERRKKRKAEEAQRMEEELKKPKSENIITPQANNSKQEIEYNYVHEPTGVKQTRDLKLPPMMPMQANTIPVDSTPHLALQSNVQ